MKAPAFWAARGPLARVLAPLGAVTAGVTARRVARPGFDCGVAVFCAGNAGVGGAGKTILARHLLGMLAGRAPFALTRGHGGALAGPVLVAPGTHDAAAVGDEALLLAADAPTVVARDRAAGARLAVALGAGAIVMDDGLQNPGLVKTRSFLVVDGGAGFGNGFLLPAGPLREPVAAAAARSAACVLIGADRAGVAPALPPALPVLRARLAVSAAEPLAGVHVFAFAGIGRPGKFFESLAGLGAVFAGARAFGDHHRYAPADEAALAAEAARVSGRLVCTEKDYVKLSASFRATVLPVRARLVFEAEETLARLLA